MARNKASDEWLPGHSDVPDEPPPDWKPTLPDDELEDIALAPEVPHPTMPEAAFHGLAGEFVRLVEPATEADNAAILVQFLVAVGNLVGRHAYATVGPTRHFLNEYAVIVGDTSTGRKGTGADLVRFVLEEVDPTWTTARVMEGGLSTGEGVVLHVRDRVLGREAVRERGKAVQYVPVVIDEGEPDKRLFIAEGEFAQVLRVAKREGNTLSPTLRNAWDGKDLRTMTKNSPLKATGPHISLTAHITLRELKAFLADTENWSGFSNRFLWIVSRRSKLLPDGGELPDLTHLVDRLREVVEFAKGCNELRRDASAAATWRVIYNEIAHRYRPGALGGVLGRAAPHMVRLSCIYAILDQSNVVRLEHVQAAAAVWDCCERSTAIIFGDVAENSLEEKILRHIRENPGCTRTELYGVGGNHTKKPRLVGAIATLRREGHIRIESGNCPKTNRKVDHHYPVELPMVLSQKTASSDDSRKAGNEASSQIRSFAGGTDGVEEFTV